jgi:phage terminase Nu1 subunit (DNA packaging protein)
MGYISSMNNYAADFFGDVEVLPPLPRGRGTGDKSRVGRKTNDVRDESSYQEYARAKARKESALADKAELEAAKMVGALVERAAVRDAAAKALATISQAIRAIPDTLERRMGIAPDVVQAVEQQIDESMDELAADLERLCQHGLG